MARNAGHIATVKTDDKHSKLAQTVDAGTDTVVAITIAVVATTAVAVVGGFHSSVGLRNDHFFLALEDEGGEGARFKGQDSRRKAQGSRFKGKRKRKSKRR
jgi:hypothetical protein